MKKFTALLLLVWMLLVACSGSKNTPESGYTKTILVWRGASAEQIRDELLVLALLRRAVVYDGEATLFHKATMAEVRAELEQARKRWSDEIELSEVQTFDGVLPDFPELETKERIVFEADRQVMSQFGITLSDLAEQLGDEFSPTDANWIVSATDGDPVKKTITTPNGLAIPLENLGVIELVEVTRPLMIEMAGP